MKNSDGEKLKVKSYIVTSENPDKSRMLRTHGHKMAREFKSIHHESTQRAQIKEKIQRYPRMGRASLCEEYTN